MKYEHLNIEKKWGYDLCGEEKIHPQLRMKCSVDSQSEYGTPD